MARAPGLLLALALLGCAAKPSEPCNSRVDVLVAQLDAADPHEQARIVGTNTDMVRICEMPLLYVFDLYHGNELTDAGRVAFARACVAEPEVDSMLYSDRLGEFYDACGFARFGVVSRSEYLLQPMVHPFTWAVHQSMLDLGLSADQARPITRAWLLWERAEASPLVLEDLRLPASEGEREFEGLVVQISPSAMVIDDMTVAQLDGGVLGPDDLSSWYGELEEYADQQRSIDEDRGEPPDISLVIAADIDTPRATIAEVIHMASRIGYTRFATLGEPQPFVYAAQPVFAGTFQRGIVQG